MHAVFGELAHYDSDPFMKASESEWSNQRQEGSISYKKFLPGKIITCMEMIGKIP